MSKFSKVVLKCQPKLAEMIDEGKVHPSQVFSDEKGNKAYLWECTDWDLDPDNDSGFVMTCLYKVVASILGDGYGFAYWRQGEMPDDISTKYNPAGIEAGFTTTDSLLSFRPASGTIWTDGCVVAGKYLSAGEIAEIRRLMDIQEGKDILAASAEEQNLELSDAQYEEIAKDMKNTLVRYADSEYYSLISEVTDAVLKEIW